MICFAGPEGSAPYAMYLSWVVIAAGGYLTRRQTAAHGAVAVAGYWLALEIAGPSAVRPACSWRWRRGTAAVAAFVMAGLATHMRGVVSRLEDDARTDPLTGLDNRRALRDEFGRELARAERTGRPLALVVLDLDHFKEYNDAFGHPAGDDALQRVAAILEDITRSVEVTARMGGEEFAVVAPDTDGEGGFALGRAAARRGRAGVRVVEPAADHQRRRRGPQARSRARGRPRRGGRSGSLRRQGRRPKPRRAGTRRPAIRTEGHGRGDGLGPDFQLARAFLNERGRRVRPFRPALRAR